MLKAIGELDQAVRDDVDALGVSRLDPYDGPLLAQLSAAIAPHVLPEDFTTLIGTGGVTPFQWALGGIGPTPQLLRSVIGAVKPHHVEVGDATAPEVQVVVGQTDRDVYWLAPSRNRFAQAPVLMDSTNALFTVPVAPSLGALFRGFAAAVRLWRESMLPTDVDGWLALRAWWEPLAGLPSDPIPGIADALLTIYRREAPDWPEELPVWDGFGFVPIDDRYWRYVLHIA